MGLGRENPEGGIETSRSATHRHRSPCLGRENPEGGIETQVPRRSYETKTLSLGRENPEGGIETRQ